MTLRRATLRWRALSIALGIAVLAVWQAVVAIGDIPELVLPAPSRVADEIGSSLSYLVTNAGHTMFETVVGFALGSAVGILLALALYYGPWLRPAIYPYLVTAQVLPKVALAPVFVIWLGFGPNAKIAIAALVCFFPVVINMARGLDSVPADLLALMAALGAKRREVLGKVLLPHSMPYLFAALKVSIGLALIGAVIGEFVGADNGLGYVLTFTIANVDTPLTLAAIFSLAVMGLAMFGVVALAERLLVPWQRSDSLGVGSA